MSVGAPGFSSFRCSAEQSRKDKGPGCCPKPPQSATPHVHRPWAAITLFGEEPINVTCPERDMIGSSLSLPMSVHSNPGVYALLIGSGVSRSSGVPTGWEIVIELIRRLAKMKGEECDA